MTWHKYNWKQLWKYGILAVILPTPPFLLALSSCQKYFHFCFLLPLCRTKPGEDEFWGREPKRIHFTFSCLLVKFPPFLSSFSIMKGSFVYLPFSPLILNSSSRWTLLYNRSCPRWLFTAIAWIWNCGLHTGLSRASSRHYVFAFSTSLDWVSVGRKKL